MKYLCLGIFLICIVQNTQSQIPVANEPLHYILYEDADIRVLEIVAMPGDTALMHQHDYSYCYIAIKGGKMWLEDLGKESRTVNLPTHYAGGKFDLITGPFTHRFANIDTSEIQFFTVEHKSGIASIPLPSELPKENILESELFTIRKLEIAPLSSKDLAHNGLAILLILGENSLITTGEEKLEYWKRYVKDEPIRVINMAKVSTPIAVFEIY